MQLKEQSGRYALRVDALVSEKGGAYVRDQADTGQPVGDPADRTVRIRLGGTVVLVLRLGENGLMLRSVKLAHAGRAVITAVVTPGEAAPDWMPAESQYLLFDGDSAEARSLPERYIPLDGMAEEPGWPSAGTTPLDRLAVAIGRSVARANAALVRIPAEGGVALVSGLTMRVAIDQTALANGRVLVSLSGENTAQQSTQYIEFTMTTVPSDCTDQGMSEMDNLPTINASTVDPSTVGTGGGAAGSSGAATAQSCPVPAVTVSPVPEGGERVTQKAGSQPRRSTGLPDGQGGVFRFRGQGAARVKRR